MGRRVGDLWEEGFVDFEWLMWSVDFRSLHAGWMVPFVGLSRKLADSMMIKQLLGLSSVPIPQD